jgi:hypothetical protein
MGISGKRRKAGNEETRGEGSQRQDVVIPDSTSGKR